MAAAGSVVRWAFAAAAVLACGMLTVQAAPTVGSSREASAMKDIRFVIFHTPGPKWVAGKSLFEQEGVQAHVEHYRRLHTQGKLALGGPHLDAGGGGMMIPEAGLSEQELTEFAQADPAVQSGLLLVQVRPWLIGMKR